MDEINTNPGMDEPDREPGGSEVPISSPVTMTRSIYVIIGVIVIVTALAIPSLIFPQRYASQERAMEVLNMLSDLQDQYAEIHGAGVYGTFDQLVRSSQIDEGYTLENMIADYTITWVTLNTGVVNPVSISQFSDSTYSIIAWPADPGSGLSTFAVTEDGVLREYAPDISDPDSVKTWKKVE